MPDHLSGFSQYAKMDGINLKSDRIMKKRAKKAVLSSDEILGTDGLLSKAIPGFKARDAQLTMATTIDKALTVDAQLVIEAGTGTGKTFAYLIPIFISQKKAIISTGTKNLQDQLFYSDIPVIKNFFPNSRNIVLLKGRANYLCRLRLQNNIEDGRFASRQLVTQLHIINEWSVITQTGDISELNDIPEDSLIWSQVTSTPDNCLNQDCEFYNDCFVVKARQKAMAADIIVINHYLYFADIALQEEGFGELLPGAEIVVFDEAHLLPDIASQFFSTGLSGRQLIELARDSQSEASKDAKDMNAINDAAEDLQTAVHDLRTSFGNDTKRSPWPLSPSDKLKNNIEWVKLKLQALECLLKEAAVRTKGLENCWRRSGELIDRFNLLTGDSPANTVHWYETFSQSFSIQQTPMIVAENFKLHIQKHKRSWIYTSATLTVNNSFQLFIETMGLSNALQLQLKSPFNYQEQSLLYVPRGIPDPNVPTYLESLINAIVPILKITQGKAFILFTSYKALDYAAQALSSRIEFPLLLQGSMPKRELVDQFKQLGNAVLLGTSSFWYGVDVRGDALSCVIIDKLPFAAPDDPILQARIQALKKQGVDPFVNYQLPQSVLTLKQGAGRLIRDVKDRGLLVICDPRIVGMRYGETFIRSLPDMPRTREISQVEHFFENITEHS